MMKVFKKVLIASMSLAVVALTTSAMAASTAEYDSTTAGAEKVVATLDTADFATGEYDGQMTVVVVPSNFGSDSTAADIYYINQEAAGTDFANILANMGLKAALTDGTEYQVRIGGENLTAYKTIAVSMGTPVTVVYGDVDASGAINGSDAAYIAQFYVGSITEFPDATNGATAADVDASGAINGSDAAYVAQYYVGSITSFPAEAK